MSTSRLNQLQVLLKESPNDVFLLYAIALEYIASGERSNAEQYFKKVLNLDVNYLPVYYQLALFYQEQDKALAIRYCKEGIALAQQTDKSKTRMELQSLLDLLQDE
ncbi:MAG: hypothetical protein UZ10_BCD003000203 [Bacteroidetes bacterium OLB10]|nr:MAG: hypothetical protein UZ10_BCD003000203 [Bacteroidetes bacterium OLB10]MBX3105693.1 tetratricopeptide repeat protein [Bacteroidota bacterium]MCE7955387.1 tetratricopeptide repeat protein [Bacteroidetes bacterium CHB6]